MARTVPLIKRCTGINNRIDPKRLRQYDPQTGVTDLAEGQNIDIDDTGQAQSRLGLEQVSGVASHSLFCDGGDAFVAQDRTSDAALYRINADMTLTGIISSQVKGARFSYFQVGNKTYYSNGHQKGVIESAVSAAWPANEYVGPDTLKDYSAAPTGQHIAYFMGRAWIAVDNTIYCSEPYKLGVFRLARCFFNFGTDVLMMRPVSGGVWVSDSETTGFIRASETWDGHRYDRKAQVPAHEWSANCRLVDLSDSQWKIPGLSAVWSSDEGLCIGTPDGQLIVATKDKLLYPTGATGATVVSERIAINTVI